MKYLLLLLAVFVIVWALRKTQRRQKKDDAAAPATRADENMVCCALCRVNLPISEAVQTPLGSFCSAEHAAEYSAGKR